MTKPDALNSNKTTDFSVTLEDIQKAHDLIRSAIRETELDKSISATKMLNEKLATKDKQPEKQVFLKFENTQFTGSFKLRGALNKMHSLTAAEKAKGVVASSAGNHAQGVAYSATLAGVKSTIVMPTTAPLIKISATQDYGAQVILHGDIYDDAFEKAKELEKEKGYTFVHPYEDAKIIAGQGTIGLEILKQLPDADTIIIPIGGGGLISGISTAVKTLKPTCKIIGVQSELTQGTKNLYDQIKSGSSVQAQVLSADIRKVSALADGISVKKPSEVIMKNFISKNVDEIITVSDTELAEAIVFLIERAKTVVEGSGAAGFAALMSGRIDPKNLGNRIVVLLCGGNIDLNIISKVISQGLIKKGRLAELSVIAEDMPGQLNKFTQIIAEHKANVLEVHHDRVSQNLFLRQTKIDFVLETKDQNQIDEIKEAFRKSGAQVIN